MVSCSKLSKTTENSRGILSSTETCLAKESPLSLLQSRVAAFITHEFSAAFCPCNPIVAVVNVGLVLMWEGGANSSQKKQDYMTHH